MTPQARSPDVRATNDAADPHSSTSEAAGDAPAQPVAAPSKAPPREIGGRDGPDPTRYGDWEMRGRCIDF